jgi:cell division transport system permease protein
VSRFMKLLKLWRTFKEGLINFTRNGWLSFATISVLALSFYVLSAIVFLGITSKLILEDVQQKINVSVYFNQDVPADDILSVKKDLEKFTKEIKSIDFISRDQALENLKSSNISESINKAIDVIGENPLFDSLLIKANNPSDYGVITEKIKEAYFKDKVNSINYDDNKKIIEKLGGIIKTVEKTGVILGSIFVLISILITFNTIRITIYSHKQEFEVMSLVGASRTYVRMPFVFEGLFYGIAAAIVATILLTITIRVVSPFTRGSMAGGELMVYYAQHFWQYFGLILLFGIILGVSSSFIAIRRYLKN